MKGKNNKIRYSLFEYNRKKDKWELVDKFKNIADISEEIGASYQTCRNIMKGKSKIYGKKFLIKRLNQNS